MINVNDDTGTRYFVYFRISPANKVAGSSTLCIVSTGDLTPKPLFIFQCIEMSSLAFSQLPKQLKQPAFLLSLRQ